MRKIVYRCFTWIQHMILRKQGYILSNNVIISNRGVYKVGQSYLF